MHSPQFAETTQAFVPVAVPSSRQQSKLHARWVEPAELEPLRKQWRWLTDHAAWRNPSFEPNYLLPALTHLANDRVRVLIVEDGNEAPKRRLQAVVPFEQKRIYRLPFEAVEIWKHDHCFDTTPLICRDNTAAVWQVICEKLIAHKVSLLSLDTVSAEPAIESVFKSVQENISLQRFQRDSFERAAFQPAASFDDYLREFVSKGLRKKTRRFKRRLEEIGQVTWEKSDGASDYEKLASEFLRIEASGWKGKAGTALDSNEPTRKFYRALIEESSREGKARFLSLKLDGKCIAMLSDIQSGHFVYSYKTAYDDTFAKFSPGQQIEVKNLEYLHEDGIELGDSCTQPDNEMMNRIWGQRLKFQNIVFSLQPGIARAVTRLLPWVQATVHRARKRLTRE